MAEPQPLAVPAGATCSICQSPVIAGEQVVACPACQMPFHQECWQENGGCAQYGCENAPATNGKEAGYQPQAQAWGDEKQCPNCRRKIKAQALKCRYCGAQFGTREAISREEFSRREYEGPDYFKMRNQVIVLFLLSATGCLSPFMLIPTGLLLFQGQVGGIQYKRLPPALRMLVAFSFFIALLLLFLTIMFVALDHERGEAWLEKYPTAS